MYHQIMVNCPRCSKPMEWACYSDEASHIVDYHCEPQCNWKGDYNHHTGKYDEYSSEDYVFSDNTPLEDAINRLAELGCAIN